AGRYYADVSSVASARGPYSVTLADARAPALFDAEQWRSFSGVTFLRDIKLADITGDGRKDVLSAVTDKLMLLPQQASGGFGDPTSSAVPRTTPGSTSSPRTRRVASRSAATTTRAATTSCSRT